MGDTPMGNMAIRPNQSSKPGRAFQTAGKKSAALSVEKNEHQPDSQEYKIGRIEPKDSVRPERGEAEPVDIIENSCDQIAGKHIEAHDREHPRVRKQWNVAGQMLGYDAAGKQVSINPHRSVFSVMTVC
jgi:hypothetical protein